MAEAQVQVSTGGDGVPHPYHLVKPSPWPIIGAFSAGLLAVGLVVYMRDGGPWVLAAGLLCLLGVMAGWWRDVVRESVKERSHTSVVKLGLRYGMALFIASEVMFFVAFFWAFYNASLFPREVDPNALPAALGTAVNPEGVWPPPGVETIPAFDLPFMMTVILLLSGCTITWAHSSFLENNRKEAQRMLGATILLGILFLCVQIYEYSHAQFGFQEGIYPSTFFMATGFHGFHVFIGTLFLSVCFLRMNKGHFTQENHFGFEASAWYWHFVDVVWLFLFASIYWWGSIPKGG